MSGESKDYKTLKDKVFKLKDRIDRIENIMVNGVPDVNYCVTGVEGWIEIKSPVEPKRSLTRLLAGNNNHPVGQDQKNWFKRQIDSGGRCYLLIATDKRWMLISGEELGKSGDINQMTVLELFGISVWSCQKPIRKESWEQLRTLLKRKL